MAKIIGTRDGKTTPVVVFETSDNPAEINEKLDEAARYYPELTFTVIEEKESQ